MRLDELFDDGPLNVTDDLAEDVMEILTPFAVAKVRYVTIQQIIDKLSQLGTGLSIDRGLIMDMLDPNKIKLVKKIEGDRIYLAVPGSEQREVDDDQAEKDAEHVSKQAAQQAQKSIQGKA